MPSANRFLRHVPNILTCSRLVLTGVLVWMMSYESLVASYLALLTFSVAALTDAFDGPLARKFGVTSPFGIFMDPLADKVLVLSALLMFVWQNVVPVWMVLIILAREFSITGLRVLAESRGVSIAAIRSGKHKMLSQTVAIIGTLFIEAVRYTVTHLTGTPYDTVLVSRGVEGAALAAALTHLPWLLLLWAMVMSVYSGIDFAVKHRQVFRAR